MSFEPLLAWIKIKKSIRQPFPFNLDQMLLMGFRINNKAKMNVALNDHHDKVNDWVIDHPDIPSGNLRVYETRSGEMWVYPQQ